jgi:hypothetical protein
MHINNVEHPWLLRYDFDSMIDFCLWALTRDGMHISPFTAHPPGDRSLSLRGMQAQEWLEWIMSIVRLREQQEKVTPPSLQRGPSYPQLPSDPSDLWRGNSEVKQHLHELWEEYRPLSSSRRKWLPSLARNLTLTDTNRQLWNDLQPYHTRIPSLTIYFVAYPQQVALSVAPASIIVTVVNSSVDSESFRQQILKTVETDFGSLA